MNYQVIGFSHKHCDQALREKLAFAGDEQKRSFLSQLLSFDFIQEAFVISTCNRVELVLATRDNFASYHSVLGLMAQHSGVDFYEIKTAAKVYDHEEAVSHFFSVISSLDSLVVGESQITGQVKEAFRFAFENGFAGSKLNALVAQGVRCAAEVRSATDISHKPISIASVAVAQAHELLGENIQGMTGVVVGAGEMGVLAAKHLLRVGCDVVLVGRDAAKTEAIAATLGENVKAATVEQLPKYINRYRLLFSATSSKEPVITDAMIENETLHRIWFDMAIPKDIEVAPNEKLKLFRIDDLKAISQQNHALREEKALQAAEIVSRHTVFFFDALRAASVEPILKHIYTQAQEAVEQELQRALKKGFIPDTYAENIRKMAMQSMKRFLHRPSLKIRECSVEKKNSATIETLRTIFEISHKG